MAEAHACVGASISTPTEPENADHADPAANIASPASRVRLCPTRSARLPPRLCAPERPGDPDYSQSLILKTTYSTAAMTIMSTTAAIKPARWLKPGYGTFMP
jgi:hypothetical protein